MNLERRIWLLGTGMLLLLVLLSTRLIYWQLVRGPSLSPIADLRNFSRTLSKRNTNSVSPLASGDDGQLKPGAGLEDLPQPVIQRTADLLASITRGMIYDRNGRLLAYDTLDANGSRRRFYTEPSLAHVIGYVSGLRTGVTGLELTYNDRLLGLDRLDSQIGQLIHQPIVGSDLTLTIDSRVQRAAEAVLQGHSGAALVLDGNSGAVLALASAPGFDPNRVLDAQYVAGLAAVCSGRPGCQGAFLDRATQALYPPGSTFKTVTLIAALDSGQVDANTVFDFGKAVPGPDGKPMYVYRVGGGVIPDPNHTEARLNLEMSYAKSANAAFARIGDEMPPDVLIDAAGRLGFSSKDLFPLEVEFLPSQLATDLNTIRSDALLRAASAIGQGQVLATPMEMGMVGLAVLDNGDLRVPYFVQAVRDPGGRESAAPPPVTYKGVMKPETAAQVRNFMITVVKRGSGTRAAVPGAIIGGKTGTAQLDGVQAPHSWFLGFAQQGQRSVVVVILIENGGEGSVTAAPLFAQLADVALHQAGLAVQELFSLPPPLGAHGGAPSGVGGAPSGASLAPLHSADLPRDPKKVDLTAAGSGSCQVTRPGPVGTGAFQWPTTHHNRVGADFRPDHPGIDLGAPPGAPITAADAGTAVYAGWTEVGYGNVVLIDHGNGYRTLYGHLSQVNVACGASVEAGQLIGLAGETGNVAGPHLHFEARVPDGFVNPWSVLPPP